MNNVEAKGQGMERAIRAPVQTICYTYCHEKTLNSGRLADESNAIRDRPHGVVWRGYL